MLRVSTMHVVLLLCIACLVMSGVGQAQVNPYDGVFGGVSYATTRTAPGLSQPFIGVTGFYDVVLPQISTFNSKASVGVLGQINTSWGNYGSAWSLSPMLCWGQTYQNSIIHVTAGFFMFYQSEPGPVIVYSKDDEDPKPVTWNPFGFGDGEVDELTPTLGVSYTYYVPNASGDQFAMNLGLQWWRTANENRYMFTITPGFLTLGRNR